MTTVTDLITVPTDLSGDVQNRPRGQGRGGASMKTIERGYLWSAIAKVEERQQSLLVAGREAWYKTARPRSA